ncbi:MAG: ABC transporter substrate-binding protein [Mariniphaga sp.]
MRYLISFVVVLSFVAGCNHATEKETDTTTQGVEARGFSIEESGGIKKLTVINPWEKARGISFEYYLVNRAAKVPDSLSGKRIIRTPVQRVICLSTTHLAYLDVLEETRAVVGISGSQYISSPEIRRRMMQEEVPDVGYGQNLNYELMVSQKPDLVLVYGVGSEVTSYTRKLEELGIPVVMVAEYLEESPLGKAGWVKFIGAFFEKEQKADAYFLEVKNEYNRLKQLAAKVSDHPRVLVGSPYKDAWWVPGGKSYLANLIADAGGSYIGQNNPSHESYVISFENALAWGGMADIWINMGNLASKKELLAADQRFENFEVYKKGKLYNNIKRLSSHGGNDFWESGTVNPHLILRDLITIFHPGLIDEELVYYREIE